MWILSQRLRREARSRALSYAVYFMKMYGPEAEQHLASRKTQQRRGSYHWLLYKLAIREVRLRRRG